MLRGAGLCLRLGLDGAARALLQRTGAGLPNSRRTRRLISRAFAGHPARGRIADIRAADLASRLQAAAARRDYPAMLALAAECERIERPMPIAVGEALARQMVSPPGRARLRQAAETALKSAPDSPYLLYVVTMAIAEEGDPGAASLRVGAALEALMARPHHGAGLTRARRAFDSLRDSWRVADQIAREATGWADDAGGGTYADLALIGQGGRIDRTALVRHLNFKEPLLQARDEEGYLAACRREFDAQATLLDRIRLISEMLRQGVRRQASYSRAYAQAGQCYDGLRAAVAALTPGVDPAANEAATLRILRTIVNAMNVLRTLDRAEEIAGLKRQMLDFAGSAATVPDAFWLALPELVVEGAADWQEAALALRRRLPDMPAREHELRGFFRWALHGRDFAEAHRVLAALPAALAGTRAMLYMVNILQRESKFGTALRVLREVNAAILARPSRLRPHEHWGILRRHGELKFLSRTAQIFAQVPQPAEPVGVVVLAARNIDQLRKYPLAVMLELRRRGWAVVNLVEGLLPVEPSGRPEIDLLAGCITIERGLTAEAEAAFPRLEGFRPDPAAGRLDWMGLGLSHSLLEDARIARRTYDVDFSCPALQQALARLCGATELMARALVQARRSLGAAGLRAGFLSLYNSRLPDSLFRLYCQAEGDPQRFFALQTANGYENYFANFANPISTRCVIRNVTLHPEVRSASFPTPANFDRYVAANRDRAGAVLGRVEAIAMARRTEGADTGPDPEAQACAARIEAWRGRGGHVACLFGRVVCDSAVPFDGGPVHADLKTWLNQSIEAVRGADTLLLIKPHPHEMNEQIATYLNQYFRDLIEQPLPDNVIYLGHRWFDIAALRRFVDLGLVYKGTVAVELALMGIPCLQANHFGPIDYPLGHPQPQSRAEYEAMLRFERPAVAAADMPARAALWLDNMSNGRFALDYRYHARPVTNRVV